MMRKLKDILFWKKPKIDAIPKEWIWCRNCKKRWKVEPDETPDDCAKRFWLKRINKREDIFDEKGIYVCEICFKKA